MTGGRSGLLRTTPVATFEFEGRRYVPQAIPDANWVANVRAAGWALLGRGRQRRRVWLVEPPGDPEAFAAASPRIAVFRVEDAA